MTRPRLLAPGLLELVPTFVGAEHEVARHALAGYRLGEDVTNWKNSYTFVALDDLSLEDKVRFAPKFEAVWRKLAGSEPRGQAYRESAAASYERLKMLLANARLLLVDGTDGRDLAPTLHFPLDGGARVIEIGFQRNADDYFQLSVRRGKTKTESVSVYGAFHAVIGSMRPDSTEGSGNEDSGNDRQLMDRILRAATDGLVDSAQIALAFWMTDVLSLELWEEHLTAIDAFAAPRRALAERLAAAIDAAPDDADAIEVEPWGTVRRRHYPAARLKDSGSQDSLEAHVQVRGAPHLDLPAESVWILEADDEPLPAPPRELFVSPAQPVMAEPKRMPVWVLVLAAAVVLAVIFVSR